MPQMSPLLWSYLFLLFSTLLLISLIKIYFFSFNSISSQAKSSSSTLNQPMNWMW